MTDEAYERIKADEKEHLRKMKALKEKARRLQRAQKTEKAARGTDRAQALLDESHALARELNQEAARSDARLDMALGTDDENAPGGDERTSSPEARARELVRRLRSDMDGHAPGSGPSSSGDDRPDKTIGPVT